MFRVFSKIWNSLEVNSRQGSDRSPPGRPASGPDRRHAEAGVLAGFAGRLFRRGRRADSRHRASKVRDLIDECGKELASQIATNILIIEDEALIAMDLQSLVENLGHEVEGIARPARKPLRSPRTRTGTDSGGHPARRGSSVSMPSTILLNTFEVPVIFITAYPERFLTGMRPEPAFLITKPYQPAMVSAVISQALFFERKAHKTKSRAVG
jgi:hypothetical protein